jgi:hypothetical protein
MTASGRAVKVKLINYFTDTLLFSGIISRSPRRLHAPIRAFFTFAVDRLWVAQRFSAAIKALLSVRL